MVNYARISDSQIPSIIEAWRRKLEKSRNRLIQKLHGTSLRQRYGFAETYGLDKHRGNRTILTTYSAYLNIQYEDFAFETEKVFLRTILEIHGLLETVHSFYIPKFRYYYENNTLVRI